jgi:hypothetical protein
LPNPKLPTEDNGMKHLLNGVMIAAAVAIATPALAQAPMTPGAPKAPPAAAAPAPSAGASMAAKPMKHRKHRKMVHRGGKAKASAGDKMTEQLNREELARIQGGAAAAPAAPPAPEKPAPMQGPRPSGH